MRLKNFNVDYGSKVFRSFSDISRIRIMNILYNRKESCIADLEMILNFTQTKTSRHVNYLKNESDYKIEMNRLYNYSDTSIDTLKFKTIKESSARNRQNGF